MRTKKESVDWVGRVIDLREREIKLSVRVAMLQTMLHNVDVALKEIRENLHKEWDAYKEQDNDSR